MNTEKTTAVLLCNLGTPDAPTPAALRRYLTQFLSDPRVVEIPRLFWLPLLHGVILRVRPRRSAAKYASVWSDTGSPLAVWTQRQAELLGQRLRESGLPAPVLPAMRYGQPAVGTQLQALLDAGVQRVLVLPLYPQYSAATTASLSNGRRIKCLTLVDDFSRECVDIAVDHGIGGEYVTRLLDQAAQFRGYPRAIRTDQGPEFTSRAFMAWAAARGVRHLLNDAGCPTQNAYIESFNGKFRDECLNEQWFETLAQARQEIACWRRDYNEQRPHSSLGRIPPAKFAAEPRLRAGEARQTPEIK